MWNYNYCIYIVTNPDRTVLYIGVTNNLKLRVQQHFNNRGNKNSFAGKYYCYNLVYYEHFTHVKEAIAREKMLKRWARKKKEELIRSVNPLMQFILID